jgi:hypothetical protein
MKPIRFITLAMLAALTLRCIGSSSRGGCGLC